ncbi:MAG: glycoside hydrolase N-terminal domain-containing protein [Saprospiraceae bacterium]|nr:glycoside hydrolase N-terminal domain-containing protein [Saprospiraceae bacterium]
MSFSALKSQSDHLLWYDRPAQYFEESLMLGNGKMGACVFGGTDVDSIYLNDITLWSGEPVNPAMNPDEHTFIPKIREALAQKSYSLADSLQKKVQGSFSQSYAPLGTMKVHFLHADSITNYYRDLDISNAISTVTYHAGKVKFRREYFVSHPDQLMIYRLTASEAGAINFDLSFSSLLQHVTSKNYHRIEVNGSAPVHAEPSYRGNLEKAVIFENDRGTRFTVYLKILKQDGQMVDVTDAVGLRNATQATIFISTATSFNGFDKNPATQGLDNNANAKKQFQLAESKPYQKLKLDHVHDYQTLYNRVKFNLGQSKAPNLTTTERLKRYATGAEDKNLEVLYFQFGRYLLISSSRTDGVPANLQGLWNPYMRPPWSSNYTVNINLQENYWPAEVTNLSELHNPLLGFIGNLAKTGAITARTFYGVGGWTVAHNSDIWAMSNPVGEFGQGDPVWANWNMGGAWLSTHLWEHFLFDQDTAYLRDYAYPLMFGAAQFCLDWLVEDKQGNFITSPSTSPENQYKTPDGYVGATLAGATADLAMIRECFSAFFANYIKASMILDEDEAFRNGIAFALGKLRPYQIGSKGQLQEWYEDWEDQDPQHRHQTHLFGLYPGHQISPNVNPDLASAAKRSLEIKGDESTGWSKGWRISLWARLLDGDHAYKMYRTLLKYVEPDHKINYSQGGGTYPNLWDAHPPFQIDGNFGGTAGVAEMLLQSSESEIHVLPALPSAWSEGSVKGLRARGGFEVNVDWSEGGLKQVEIFAAKGGITQLNAGGQKIEIKLKPGERTRLNW